MAKIVSNLVKQLNNLSFKTRSLDKIWEEKATDRIFSFIDKQGIRRFYADEMRCKQDILRFSGEGKHKKPDAYKILTPDCLINKISGDISRPKKSDTLQAYIDGSFSQHKRMHDCTYGVFFVCKDKTAEYANSIADDGGKLNSTGAEIIASIVAIKVAIAHGYKSIEIFHDYNGISGTRKRQNFTQKSNKRKACWIFEQYTTFLECAKQYINISFTHIRGHSLDMGNEHAHYIAYTFSKRSLNLRMHLSGYPAEPPTLNKKRCKKEQRKLAKKLAILITQGNTVAQPFTPSYKPKNALEREYRNNAQRYLNHIANVERFGISLTPAKLEQIFIGSTLAQDMMLTEEEYRYVRMVLSGAEGTGVISRKMSTTKARIKAFRSSVCQKCNIPIEQGDHGIIKWVVTKLAEQVHSDIIPNP